MSRIEPMPGYHLIKSPVLEESFRTEPLRVHHMGRTLGNPLWGRFSSKVFYHRLYFFLKGRASVGWGNSRQDLAPGRVHLFPAGRHYRLQADGPFDKFYLSFTLNFAPAASPVLDPLLDLPPPKPLTFAQTGFDAAWLKNFENPSLAETLFIRSTVMRALAHWIPDATLSDLYARSRTANGWQDLLAFIEKGEGRGPTVAECARHLGLTPTTLTRKFKEDFGTPLKLHLERLLVARARTELLSTPDRIKVIADRLGFPYESYFSRFFRRHTGQTPEGFRQKPNLDTSR